MNEVASIREPLLRELMQVPTSVHAMIAGREKGFAVLFRVGDSDRTLATSRGSVRLFATLDTAGAFVRDLGIPRFTVDMASHRPGRLRGARPDRAEALRKTRTRLQQQPLEFTDAESAAV